MNGRTLALCTLAAVSTAALPPAARAEAPSRDALEKWVQSKELLSREREEWRLGRQLLLDRIDLVEREIAALQERAKEAEGDIGEADEKLAEMQAENEELKAATGGLADSITTLEARLQSVLQRTPAPLVERVKPLSQRIPDEPAATDMGLSERFQNVIGILNEMNKFSREIAEASEVRDLPDGSNAEVTVLYVGLGQAYYCNQKSGIAGIGRPGENGWVWEPHNDLSDVIAEVIAVYRNEKPATYVALPVEIQ